MLLQRGDYIGCTAYLLLNIQVYFFVQKLPICVDDFRMRNKSNNNGIVRVNNKIDLTKE